MAAAGLGAVTTQAKFVYADGSNALTLMLCRFVVSSVVIGLLVALSGHSVAVAKAHRRDVLAVGLVWSGSMICYLQSVETISVSVAVLILYSYPVMVMAVSMLRGAIRATRLVMLAFVAAFAGLVMMLGGGEIRVDFSGIVFAFLGAAGAAFTFLRGGRVAPRVDAWALAFWVNIAGIALILPLAWDQVSFPAGLEARWFLAGATASYIVAILAQFRALALVPAAHAAMVFNFEPVVSILLAMWLLSETLTPLQWSGAVLVIAVLVAFTRLQSREAPA